MSRDIPCQQENYICRKCEYSDNCINIYLALNWCIMFFTGIYDWEKKYGLRSILQIQRQKKKE